MTIQFVECRDAIRTGNDGFTIDREGLRLELERCTSDCRKPIGPVIAKSRKQTQPVAVAPDNQTVAVVLDFMQPALASRRLAGKDRLTGRDEFGRQDATFWHRRQLMQHLTMRQGTGRRNTGERTKAGMANGKSRRSFPNVYSVAGERRG
jgi:hypothetical protein